MLIILASCNRYNEQKTSLLVVSSIADCEEENIHLEIIEADDEEIIGHYILPICEFKECQNYFFNMTRIDTLKQYEIEGFMSKKPHGYMSYGCIDAKYFKIIDFKIYENK